ncbi:hypothetical protein CRUP_024669 [Coryphaenoides rupestris]|nr:hypothetical protein CRUP_001230 [Coryphaenoides rupestris]KAG7247119.1 hypothetical protein CRUP_024669 [Coryphaenoides rupestris]
MDTKASGRLGVLTITYYLWTTFIAVIVGIILVLIIHPGTGTEKETGHHVGSGPVMTSADALLDLIRASGHAEGKQGAAFESSYAFDGLNVQQDQQL